MKIFALSPSYLSIEGDGVHERSIAQRLMVTDQLFIVVPNVFLPPFKKFIGLTEADRNGRLLSLPVLRPTILFDFFYGVLFSLIFTFFKLLGRRPFDIIYVRDVSAAIGLNLLKSCHRIPVVLKIVDFVADELFAFRRDMIARIASYVISVMEKVAIIKSDMVMVPSELFKTELMKRYGVSGSKIRPLSSGVDINEFSSSVGGKRTGSSFTIGYFGSLVYLNDIDCLLKA